MNDYLIKDTMLENHTNKVFNCRILENMYPSIRKEVFGNYSTAFSVVCNTKETDVWRLAQYVTKVIETMHAVASKLMLVLPAI